MSPSLVLGWVCFYDTIPVPGCLTPVSCKLKTFLQNFDGRTVNAKYRVLYLPSSNIHLIQVYGIKRNEKNIENAIVFNRWYKLILNSFEMGTDPYHNDGMWHSCLENYKQKIIEYTIQSWYVLLLLLPWKRLSFYDRWVCKFSEGDDQTTW